MADTLVFVPAWNEEDNLGAVLTELAEELPEADLLVVDDGSTDGTVAVARAHGADVLSFGENRGLRAGIAAGYGAAAERGYAYCGRVDADGQHPAGELRRLLQLVREGECDVAVGSRFVSGDGYPAYRYEPSPARRLGTGLLRRAMRIRLGRRFGDATSGMYAANAMALPFLAEPYTSGAPEVEGLVRVLRHLELRAEREAEALERAEPGAELLLVEPVGRGGALELEERGQLAFHEPFADEATVLRIGLGIVRVRRRKEAHQARVVLGDEMPQLPRKRPQQVSFVAGQSDAVVAVSRAGDAVHENSIVVGAGLRSSQPEASAYESCWSVAQSPWPWSRWTSSSARSRGPDETTAFPSSWTWSISFVAFCFE